MLKISVTRSEKSRSSVEAKTLQRLQEFAGRVLVNVDVNSGMFTLAVWRRSQRLEFGLTLIGGFQVLVIPLASFGGARGLPPKCGPPPMLLRGRGNWCASKTVGDITRGQIWVPWRYRAYDYSGDNDGTPMVVPCKLLPPSSMTLVIPKPGSNVARRYAADPAQR